MVTALILTKNEGKNISGCLDSLLWCDETLVIDDYSTDETIDILKKREIRYISHSLDNDFSQQRNFGLTQAKGEWILFIDADERVSLSLQYEILGVVTNALSRLSGYYLKRVDVMWGKKLAYGETGKNTFLRLAKKDQGEWKGTVHEKWMIKGKTGQLNNPLMHYPHQTIAEFLTEINHYTTIRSEELLQKKSRTHWWMVFLYPLGKFIQDYLIKLGFLDGIAGLIVAILMSFHSFLVRSKVWTQTHT